MKNLLFCFLSLLLVMTALHAETEEIELPEGYTLQDPFDEDSDEDPDEQGSQLLRKGFLTKEDPLNTQILETLPSSVVAGCVNTLSGDFFESQVDLITPGPEPLVVQRSWNSSERKWHFGHQPRLHVGQSTSGRSFVAAYMDDNGSGMQFRTRIKDFINTLKVPSQAFEKGITNCGSGEISGQTNWKNAAVYYVKKKDKRRYIFKHGSHIQRVFKRYKKEGKKEGVTFGKFHLVEEHHPNGNILKYTYDLDDHLRSVRTFNSQNTFLQSLELRYGKYPHSLESKHDKPTIKWHSQAGHVIYNFNKKKKKLYSTNPSHAIPVSYQYDSKKRIIAKIEPDERCLLVQYNKKGKVKKLASRVGPNNTLDTTHTFAYTSDHGNKKTDVYDASKNLTRYRYKKDRLQSISRCSKTSILSKDFFTWDSTGNLTSRMLSGDGKIHFRKTLHYDAYGNVTKESLVGNLTGNKEAEWLVGQSRNNQNIEEFIKTYTTYKGGRHLPKEENDGRKWIQLAYLPNSNLLKHRLTGSGETIIKREFFEYDNNGILVKEILDDGIDDDPLNLHNISERHIKIITPTSAFPIGLPEKVDELCLDIATGEQIPIKSTTYLYSPQGKPLQEQHFDSQGLLAYTLYWEYNHLGHITKQTDPFGHSTYFCYDQNGNKISEESSDLLKEYTYDCANRLIKEEEIWPESWPEGIHLITSHQYNTLNQKTSTTDIFGKTTCYTYDALGHLTETLYPPIGNVQQPTAKTEYDAMGHPIAKWDPNGHCTRIQYTARGQPYHTTFPDGSIETKKYTLDGLLQKKTDKNGLETHFFYDTLRRVIRTEIQDSYRKYTQDNHLHL